jgi:hypothetical protein
MILSLVGETNSEFKGTFETKFELNSLDICSSLLGDC